MVAGRADRRATHRAANRPGARRSYAVTGDGRFLIGKSVAENISEPITWVLNWLDERKQPVPSK